MSYFGADAFDALKLPDGWSWGEWDGDYRKVFHGERLMGRFGGLACKVSSQWQHELTYAVMKMLREAERHVF